MAMLNIDLSEYDMMRETKARLEKQLAEKEDIIKGLESRSRVVIKTDTVVKNLNLDSLRSVLIQEMFGSFIYSQYEHYVPYINKIVPHIVGILKSPEKYGLLREDYVTVGCSSQYVGFDDVRDTIEKSYAERFQREIDEERERYIEKRKEYEATKKEILSEIEEDHRSVIQNLKTKHKVQIKAFEDEKTVLKNEISDLKSQIAQLNKSTKEKVKEAEETMNKAIAAYNDLLYKPKKKKWFKLW